MSKIKRYTGRKVEKRVGYVFRLQPTKLPFYSEKDIKRYGLQIISLLD